ncbi:MAG: class I SAM-dependent methyltransferase [Selenomonadaceae bacterium]|nr:class I SAM-dependent methyltransferase [Selenomonadaceae bacterium]
MTTKSNIENIERRIEKYWDSRSADLSRIRRLELEGVNAANWREILTQDLPADKILKILDVGTGAGFFAAILSKLGHKVTGVDTSAGMIDEAKKNLRELKLDAEFFKMDAQALNFADESFDAVVTRNLTWTLPDAMQGYREWKRVLKSGGVLINFDSDYGGRNFTRDNSGVDDEVTDKMLDECTAIKNSLRISTHTRPMWDVEFLQKLGFTVQCDFDISAKVHADKNVPYDSTPLFKICATLI